MKKILFLIHPYALIFISVVFLSFIDFRPEVIGIYIQSLFFSLPFVIILKTAFTNDFFTKRNKAVFVPLILMLLLGLVQHFSGLYMFWGAVSCLAVIFPEYRHLYEKVKAKERSNKSKRQGQRRRLLATCLIIIGAIGARAYVQVVAQYGYWPYQYGLHKEYYADGRLKRKAYYKKGLLHGSAQDYYANGLLASEGYYRNGKLNGLVKTFYPNGQILTKGFYDKNVLKKYKYYLYIPDGLHLKEWDGRVGGVTKHYFWHKNGNLLFIDTYLGNKKVHRKEQVHGGYADFYYE